MPLLLDIIIAYAERPDQLSLQLSSKYAWERVSRVLYRSIDVERLKALLQSPDSAGVSFSEVLSSLVITRRMAEEAEKKQEYGKMVQAIFISDTCNNPEDDWAYLTPKSLQDLTGHFSNLRLVSGNTRVKEDLAKVEVYRERCGDTIDVDIWWHVELDPTADRKETSETWQAGQPLLAAWQRKGWTVKQDD